MYKAKAIAAIAAGLALSVCSCSTQRSPLTYFEDINQDTVLTVNTIDFAPRLQPDDELLINVTSSNPSSTVAYNVPMQNPGRRADGLQMTTSRQQTYVVDSNGDIHFPILGKIHVGGYTTEQVRTTLMEMITADVEDAEVYVRLVNFKINVAGEVKNPGPVPVPGERFTILDALTTAGDLTEYGERNNVLLVREENGKRVAHRLNLNDSEILTSPYFYLKQNDYIYVEPNKIRKDNSKYNQNNSFKISVISTIVSACSVVASLIIALTK